MGEAEEPQREPNRVSAEDKQRMARLAESLKEAEKSADDLVDGEALESMVASANRSRAARGMPPLDACNKDWDDPPELGFYRRARALGMVRVNGGGSRETD